MEQLFNILIVEDDKVLNDGLALYLKMEEKFNVISVYTKREAKDKINENKFDLIILDINLPDGSGLDLCKEIRDKVICPIMFLTACDTEVDVINGLRLGGDDYITKPFSINILKEKVVALIRRSNRSIENLNILKVDEFEFNLYKMTVSKNGKNIILAPTEYRILKILAMSKGKVITREELINDIWESGEFIEEHTLTVNINRIRSKLGESSSKQKYIKTVYGIGYIWGGNND